MFTNPRVHHLTSLTSLILSGGGRGILYHLETGREKGEKGGREEGKEGERKRRTRRKERYEYIILIEVRHWVDTQELDLTEGPILRG